MLHRAYNVCNNYFSLHVEFNELKAFFFKNGYPKALIEKCIQKFLNNKFLSNSDICAVQGDVVFLNLPYIGHKSESLKKDLSQLLKKYFKNTKFQLIFTNNLKIQTFFRFKDFIPKGMRANLVYEFRCAECCTPVSYVGSTKRHLYERIAQHANRSARTGKLLNSRPSSNIFDHSINCSCKIDIDNFRILNYGKNEFELRILESLYIKRNNPTLNADLASIQLFIA